MSPETPSTTGVDHVGLTVLDLSASERFFTQCLGWRRFGGSAAYPSAYVTDGAARLTLWQARNEGGVFDRHRNPGLHHLALRLPTREALHELAERVAAWPGVVMEFTPEFSGAGPKVHAMFLEPGGCRIELSWDPR